MPISLVILAVLVLFGANTLILASADSDSSTTFVLIFIGFPIFIATCFWASFTSASAIKQGRTTLGKIGGFLGTVVVVALSLSAVRWHSLHPKRITYAFDYGQSASWHEVQFHSIEAEGIVKGPWIGGYPLSVSFPDLNADGHRDIRVRGNGRIAEYEYLPKPDGARYWHLVRNEGFMVSYPPDGHYFP